MGKGWGPLMQLINENYQVWEPVASQWTWVYTGGHFTTVIGVDDNGANYLIIRDQITWAEPHMYLNFDSWPTIKAITVFAGGSCTYGVVVSDFAAQAVDGRVELNWSTSEETDIAGWNVYRSEHRIKGFSKINDEIIAPFQYDYDFEDGNVETKRTYWYKIEAVSLKGQNIEQDPISVTVDVTGDTSRDVPADDPDSDDQDIEGACGC